METLITEMAAGSIGVHIVADRNDVPPAFADGLGLWWTGIFEARRSRDSEQAEYGIVRCTLDALTEQGVEPTRVALRRNGERRCRRPSQRLLRQASMRKG